MAYLFKSLAQRDEAEIEAFQSRMEFSRHGFVFKVMPQLERDIHDLEGLYELGQKLFQA